MEASELSIGIKCVIIVPHQGVQHPTRQPSTNLSFLLWVNCKNRGVMVAPNWGVKHTVHH